MAELSDSVRPVSKPSMLTDSISAFANQKYINLETYRKNGEGVQTPVWFIENDGLIYVNTGEKTWKVKRMRRKPEVLLVPSSFRGRPKGNWLRGEARFVDGTEAGKILRLFDKKYGLMGRLIIFIEKLVSGKRIILSINLKE